VVNDCKVQYSGAAGFVVHRSGGAELRASATSDILAFVRGQLSPR
jgi:hypothetical protein